MALITFVKSAFKNVTVEFYLFLFMLGYALFTAASFPLFYSKVCRGMFPVSVCANLSSNPVLENRVQFASSEWMAYLELARFLPTLFGTMLLGSFGDHYSTKPPILISLVFMIVYMFAYNALITFDQCPLYLIILASTVLAIGGQMASFITLVYSFVAKKVQDENRLTFRYAVLTAFWSLAYVVSGNAAPFLYKIFSYEYVMLIGEGVLCSTFVLALFFYPSDSDSNSENEKPNRRNPDIQNAPERPSLENAVSISTTDTSISNLDSGYDSSIAPRKEKPNVVGALCSENALLYRSAWKTITKTRPHRGRSFLIILCLVGIVYGSQDSGLDTVTNLFAFKRPLSWTPSILAVWSAAMSFLQMFGSLIGAYAFQRCRLSNTWILFVGIISACLKMLMISISKQTWMMFAALLFGCLSTVGFSAMRAIVAQLGTDDETGELLGCLTATGSFVPVFSALIFNNVYSATLNDFDGATFAVCAALLGVCALAVIFMHAYLKRVRQ